MLKLADLKIANLITKINGLTSGQLESGFHQFMLGKLKSPSIITLGKGEDIDKIICSTSVYNIIEIFG